jgi:hypothetical protein
VREKHDEIERGRIGPVQVLEHEQEGCDACAAREQGERLLEHPELTAGRLALDLPLLSQRTESFDERLVRELRADEVDRAPDERLEAGFVGPIHELGGEPRLADSRLSGEENRGATPCLRLGEGAVELFELTCASDEHFARASLHSGKYRSGA